MNELHDKVSSREAVTLDISEENVYGQLAEQEELVPREVEYAPEGWITDRGLAVELDVGFKRVHSLTELYPEERIKYKSAITGKLYWHNSPLLCDLIREKVNIEYAPPGWLTDTALAKELKTDSQTINRLTEQYAEMRKEFKIPTGRIYWHNSPELCNLIREKINIEYAPQGWLTDTALANELNVAPKTINRLTEQYPEMRREYKRTGATQRVHWHNSPELCNLIREGLSNLEYAPAGWMTDNALAKELGVGTMSVIEFTKNYSDMRREYRTERSKQLNFYNSPELCNLVRDRFVQGKEPPEGWITDTTLSKLLKVDAETVMNITKNFPEMRDEYKSSVTGRFFFYNSPGLIKIVEARLAKSRAELLENEQQRLSKESFVNLLVELKEGEGKTSEQIRKFAELFGGEGVIDVLFQLHPEYRSLPLPYVKSVIPDYLGEFLRVRGNLDLESLAAGKEMLSNSNLQDMLLTVLKSDCLRHFNEVKRATPEADDHTILTSYVDFLRKKTQNLSSEELSDIFNELDIYYKSIFDINLPDSLMSELGTDRKFPDLNQRINVAEIADKRKMLIADEMGVGKSASAILAKESLGVKQALVVAPSNVISTWQRYLSDGVDEKGKQVGYFKPGQAPKVLVVKNISEVTEGAQDYDYILLSQERLTDKYTAELTKLSYGMLIVDESHKLKQLRQSDTRGKRSANLIKLAEEIHEDEEKYLTLLSGTPVPNKVGDVAMVLKLLYPEKFADVPNNELTAQIVAGDVLDTRSLLVARMEAKSLTDSIEMPKLTETISYVTFSKEEREIYDMLLDEDELEANQKIHLLRQFSINPQMLRTIPEIIGSKSLRVGESLRKDFLSKDKIVMFVNGYKEGVLRGDSTIFHNLGLPDDVEIQIIDGDNRNDRADIQERFQTVDKKILLVVNGQTADVGVDFSAGEAVKFYNEPWTEYDKKQQLGRVFRYGLKHDITSETFIMKDSIEEGIHTHIRAKYVAVEKLLRGIPLSEIEKQLVRQGEHHDDKDLEVNSDLAQDYLSSWGKLMKIFGNVKEIGEERFVEKFLPKHGADYANAYIDIGSRSYQANASRLAGTLLSNFITTTPGKSKPRILDIASGPEMLRRHIPDKLDAQVYSVDINKLHFAETTGKGFAGSFKELPVQDGSFAYANLALALHYTSFAPSRGNYERLEVLQEINRVLQPGGRAVLSLMFTLDLKDPDGFTAVIEKCGFKVNKSFSGEVGVGDNFRTRVITLEKVDECNQDTKELAAQLGRELLNGLKFAPNNARVSDSRKIITHFKLGRKNYAIKFNKTDLKVLSEEHAITTKMEELKKRYKAIESIPIREIVKQKMARIKVGRKYILFKPLASASGAVRFG